MPNEGGELVRKKYLMASAHRINCITLMCLCSDLSIERMRETDQLVYCTRPLATAVDVVPDSEDLKGVCEKLAGLERMASALAESRSYITDTVS
jgi:hypothetical protein